MEKRPITIQFLSAVFLSAPVVCLIYLFMNAHGNWHLAVTTLTLDFVAFAAGAYFTGLGLWRVRPWGYISFLLFALGVVGYNIYQFVYSRHELSLGTIAVCSLLIGSIVLLLQKHARTPYFNPRVRWWERADRERVSLKGDFKINGQLLTVPVLDISLTGVFAEIPIDLSPGDIVDFHLNLLDLEFHSSARVIRASESPQGYGLMFIVGNRKSQRAIRTILYYLIDLKRRSHATRLPAQ